MRFLANENASVVSIHYLHAAEHDVSSVIQDSPGATDEVSLAQAHAEQRIILTFDCDYGELIYRHRLPSSLGVVHFRFAPWTPEEPAERLTELVGKRHVTLEGQFTIIERGWIRQRPLPHHQVRRSNHN